MRKTGDVARFRETVWDNTQIAASDRLSVTSGGDTTLRGAQVAGDSVVFDVGGKLLIETLQDASRYASKQSSSGFDLSLCIPPICFGAIVQSASFNASSQKIKHAYQSAVGQSGIAAGDGGFDITVGRSTELVGGRSPAAPGVATARTRTSSLPSAWLNDPEVKARADAWGEGCNLPGWHVQRSSQLNTPPLDQTLHIRFYARKTA